jgi:hypothetical protein
VTESERLFATGDYQEALRLCRGAVAIKGGPTNRKAEELYDKIAVRGRAQEVVDSHLVFDINRTILAGGVWEFIDATADCRRILARYPYEKDAAALIHIPCGRIQRLPEFQRSFYSMARISPNKEFVASVTTSDLHVIAVGNGDSAHSIYSLPSGWEESRTPDFYARNLQFALDGEVIVATDLDEKWCSDKGRCEEWHLFVRKTGAVTRVQTDTADLRIMDNRFYACAPGPGVIRLFQWPFKRVFKEV